MNTPKTSKAMERRSFMGAAAITVAAAQLGMLATKVRFSVVVQTGVPGFIAPAP